MEPRQDGCVVGHLLLCDYIVITNSALAINLSVRFTISQKGASKLQLQVLLQKAFRFIVCVSWIQQGNESRSWLFTAFAKSQLASTAIIFCF